MKWPTHVIGGIITCMLIIPDKPIMWAIAGASALLPDIDKTNSKVGNMVPALSVPVSIIFGHRKFTHSLLAAGLLYFVLLKLLPVYALAITVGYLSHLLLDTLNPMGVAWFWPIPLRIRIPRIRTGSFVEGVFLFGMSIFMGLKF